MKKRPDIDKHLSQFTVAERIEDVIPGELERDPVEAMMKFTKKPASELGQTAEHKAIAVISMATLLEKFQIIDTKTVQDGNDWYNVSDMNQLAELAGVDPLPDFDDGDEDLFLKKVSPFMERIYRSERFWAEVEKRGLDPQDLVSRFVHSFRYSEVRQQLHYLKRLRLALEEVITISEEREAELRGELDDFE